MSTIDADEPGEIYVIDAVTGKIEISALLAKDLEQDRYGKIKAWDADVTAFAFFDDDRKLLAGYEYGAVRVLDITRGGAQIGGSILTDPRYIYGVDAFWVAQHMHKAYTFSFEGGSPPVHALDLRKFMQ